jgi:hypothetical protein
MYTHTHITSYSKIHHTLFQRYNILSVHHPLGRTTVGTTVQWIHFLETARWLKMFNHQCIDIHIYAYRYTHRHMYHIHTHIYIHTYTYTHIHIHTYTYIHTYIHTRAHMYDPSKYSPWVEYARRQVYPILIPTHTHTHPHTPTHPTHTHTHPHTPTHTC